MKKWLAGLLILYLAASVAPAALTEDETAYIQPAY